MTITENIATLATEAADRATEIQHQAHILRRYFEQLEDGEEIDRRLVGKTLAGITAAAREIGR